MAASKRTGAGVANTLFVTVIAIVLASVLGFLIGLARLSTHWLLSSIAGAYVEFVRNIPLLFFVQFWYFGVIASLPQPNDSVGLFGAIFLNNRGLTIPYPLDGSGFRWAAAAIAASIMLMWAVVRWSTIRKLRTGADTPLLSRGIALCGVVPLLA